MNKEGIDVILNNIPAKLIFFEDETLIMLNKKQLNECEVNFKILEDSQIIP